MDYLEALEKIGKGIDADKVKDLFDNQSEYESFDYHARTEGHISITREDKGRICRLTPKGVLYIKKETTFFKKWYRKPEWWGIIISAVIGTAGLIVAITK